MSESSKEARVIEAMFSILNKEGEMVPFRLNPAQRSYDQNRTQRDLIPKARQKGFSSLGVAYQVVKCLGVPGTRAVLISHESKATQRLLDKAHLYLKYIKGPQPEMGRHSRDELYFPKTESTYYIGTAGAKKFGRGDTITDLHISEYAFWEGDAMTYIAGLLQAVPRSGSVRIESTGNGMDNDFAYMCMNAKSLGYNPFFMPFWFDEEYELQPPEGWTLDQVPSKNIDKLFAIQNKYQLNDRKMYWWANKLLEFRDNISLTLQEYPCELLDCFQAAGGAIFPKIEQTQSDDWLSEIYEGHRIQRLSPHPIPGYTYVFGADPSGGTGNDEAAILGICLNTLEQVFEFGYNHIDPVDFAYYLSKVGQWFNEAYLVPEGNNHGIAVLSILLREYPKAKLYKRGFANKRGVVLWGWMTSETTKSQLVGMIKELWDEGLCLYGDKTYAQVKAFHEDPETKKMGAKEDGLVIALGLACIGFRKWQTHVEHPTWEKPKPKRPESYMFYTFDECFNRKPKESPILQDLRKRYGSFPLTP
jgi:hypothetical protein